MVPILRCLCLLLCSLPSFNSSPVSSVNGGNQRTLLPLSVSSDKETSGSLTTPTPSSSPVALPPTRKPVSIVDTLIVHLINSQPVGTSPESNSVQVEGNSTSGDSPKANPALTCTDGQTYWDTRESKCVPCTASCPSGAYVSRVCNRTHDLECQCHKGSYMSVVDKTCKPCAECPYGWGVWRTCRWSRNTVCRKCQPGTYSGASVGTLGCIPCSKCGPTQEMIAECDGNRDTVCVDRATFRANFSQFFPAFAAAAERNGIPSTLMINSEDLGEEDLTGERSSSSEPTVYSKSPDSNVLPVYFTILVVAFFLVIYTLTRLRCTEMMNGRSPMLTAQADAKQQLMLGQHGPGLLVPQVVTTITSPYYQGNTGAPMVAHPAFWTSPRNGGGGGGENFSTQPYNTVMHLYTSQRCKAPGRAEMEQGVSRNGSSGSAKLRPTFKAYYELLYAPGDAPALTEAGLQELPASVVSSLESKLASDSISWRMLARELGYDDTQMAEFETKSTATSTREETEGPKSAEPTVDTVKVIRSLLTDWCQRESLALTRQATVQTDDADHGDDDQGQLQTQATRAAKWPLAALVKALTRIGRVDCARLVQLCQIQTQPEPSSPKEPSNASTCTTSCVSTSSSPAS